MRSSGMLERVTSLLQKENVKFDVWDESVPDPTVAVVDKGAAFYG
jgi:alcohol dehydrogenase class IV